MRAQDLHSISKSFQAFQAEAPGHSKAWMQMVHDLSAADALDEKTRALAYLAVLSALRMESGVPFHTLHAKRAGATRDEVVSAILIGLPIAGHGVTQCLPIALETYDNAK